MKKSKRLLCLVFILVFLCGCHSAEQLDGESDYTTDHSSPGKITVYSEQRYKAALTQVFSHINLTEKSFSVEWVGNASVADIVITNNPNNYENYRAIDVQQLSVKPMEQLMLLDDQGVIGVPVFLRLCGFWYDELYFSSADLIVPRSAETWMASFPAVCEKNDVDAIFWGIVAPAYLYYGGSAEELASGQLDAEYLSNAFSYLQELYDQGLLQLTEDARQNFTSTQAAFWLASDQQIAASYNFMSNRSKLGFAAGLILPAREYSQCIVRADVLLVRENADPKLTDLFLQRFFREQTLIELSGDTQMPLACQVMYGPSVIPEMAQICYTVLSSPAVEITYVTSNWDQETENAITEALQSLLQDEITTESAILE